MNIQSQKYSQDLRRYYRLPAVQVSLTIVLSLFVMSIFIVFALRPTIISIATLKKTITESEKTLKTLDQKVANLQKVSTQLEAIKPFLPTLNTNITNNGAAYSPLTTTIESLANQTGVILDSDSLGPTLLYSRLLSPFTPNKNQSVVALPFSARVVGSYPAVMDFLTKALTMERILMIDSLAITKEAGTKTNTTSIGLSISGSAYYLADDAQLKKSLVEQKGKK